MKVIFQKGDIKQFSTKVTREKLASFDSGMVHPVYSTFALGKDVEWCGRLFVLEMLENGEEGIGTYLSIEHISPAPLGSEVVIRSALEEINGNRIETSFEVFSGERLIARGIQHQKIIDKSRFSEYIETLQKQTS